MMKSYYLFLASLLQCLSLNAQEIFIISSINIEGNKITKEDVILRVLDFSKEDMLTKENLLLKIKKSEENLQNLQLFNFIKIDFSRQFEKREINIEINVIERWYIWPYPILEVSERNFNVWWGEFKSSNYSDFSRVNYGVFLNWEISVESQAKIHSHIKLPSFW